MIAPLWGFGSCRKFWGRNLYRLFCLCFRSFDEFLALQRKGEKFSDCRTPGETLAYLFQHFELLAAR
jgi:hypothetical protein